MSKQRISHITVPAIGARAKVHGDVNAIVTAVSIRGRFKHVTIECAWMSEGTRHSEWLEPHEVTVEDNEPKQLIGFKNGE